MSLRNTFSTLIHRYGAGLSAPEPCERLELRLAPYAVTQTAIAIPSQRTGTSRE